MPQDQSRACMFLTFDRATDLRGPPFPACRMQSSAIAPHIAASFVIILAPDRNTLLKGQGCTVEHFLRRFGKRGVLGPRGAPPTVAAGADRQCRTRGLRA